MSVGRLVCVDFLHPKSGRPGGMRFLIDCGVFDHDLLETVVIQPYEISESRVAPLATALPLLSGPVRRRVRAACQADQVRYLENGRPVAGITYWDRADTPQLIVWSCLGSRRRPRSPAERAVRERQCHSRLLLPERSLAEYIGRRWQRPLLDLPTERRRTTAIRLIRLDAVGPGDGRRDRRPRMPLQMTHPGGHLQRSRAYDDLSPSDVTR